MSYHNSTVRFNPKLLEIERENSPFSGGFTVWFELIHCFANFKDRPNILQFFHYFFLNLENFSLNLENILKVPLKKPFFISTCFFTQLRFVHWNFFSHFKKNASEVFIKYLHIHSETARWVGQYAGSCKPLIFSLDWIISNENFKKFIFPHMS